MQYVRIKNPELTDTFKDYTVNETTSEIKEKVYRKKQAKYKPLVVPDYGFDYEFQVKTLFNKASKISYSDLYIPLNAKMLGGSYFEGIRLDNIKELYNSLMSCNVVEFTFKDFLYRSTCTQIEFKKDYRTDKFSESIVHLNQLINKSARNSKTHSIINKNKEERFVFIQRSKSTNTKPFIHLYNKEIELRCNSYTFAGKYLTNHHLDDLARVEFRVKDLSHAKHLGLKTTSLRYLLTIPENKKNEMLSYCVSCYLTKIITDIKPKDKKDLTSSQLIYIDALVGLMENGISFPQASQILLKSQKTPQAKSDKLRLLKSLYQDYIKKNTVDVSFERQVLYEQLMLLSDPI